MPMEAALCGCLIVCSNVKSNGMILDYAYDGKTAMAFNSIDEAVAKIENPDWSLIAEAQNLIRDKIGTRSMNMRRFVDIIEHA